MQYLESQIVISSLQGYLVEMKKHYNAIAMPSTFWWRWMHKAFLLAALTAYVWMFDVLYRKLNVVMTKLYSGVERPDNGCKELRVDTERTRESDETECFYE